MLEIEAIKMKIKDLEYYQHLVKRQNFSAVANDFHVSQPTITMAIQRLERDFDTTFFIRDHVHKQLHITPTGKQFASHVNIILNELAVARKEIARANSTKIRFGLPPIIGNYYFPPLTPLLMRHHLMEKLETYEHGSRELLQLLTHGELDVALLGSLTPLQYSNLKAHELVHYPFQIIVGPQHSLANKQKINFASLKGQSFIIPDTEFFHEQAFKQMCQAAHFRPHIIYRTNDIHIIKAMVAEGLGISFLTSLAITPADQVVSLALTNRVQPIFHLSIATRKTTILTPTKQELWNLLAK